MGCKRHSSAAPPGPSSRIQTCEPFTYASTGSPNRSSRAMISSGVVLQTQLGTSAMSVALLIAQVPLELLDEVVDRVVGADRFVLVVLAERLAAVDHVFQTPDVAGQLVVVRDDLVHLA